MAKLRLVLFGQPEIYLDGQLQQLPDKAVALLTYLALTGVTHRRTVLAELLWGDKSESRARNNLSIALTQFSGVRDYLVISRKEVGLGDSVDSDLAQFEQNTDHLTTATIEQLTVAAAVYRGDLLEGFHIADESGAATFLDWLQAQQTRLREQAHKLFPLLSQQQLAAGNSDAAIASAQRALTLDPWREETHRHLMRLYAQNGERERAIAQFQQCEQLLAEEFAVTPSDETQQLYSQILQAEPLTAVPFQAPPLPTHFVGRTQLLTDIERKITQKPLCAFVGMGGIGKSTAAALVAHRWRGRYPDGVLWAHGWKDDVLQLLVQWGKRLGRDFSHMTTFANRAAAFRELLHEKSVLVILDDVEETEFIRPIISTNQNSLILLTTRNHDIPYALNATVIPLTILEEQDSVQLLTQIAGKARITVEIEAAHEICHLLEHLPLAVEIIAQRIRARPALQIGRLCTQLSQLKSRLPQLTLGGRAVRATFELSWSLLTSELQQLFMLLAIFAGRSFDSTAAVAISGLESADLLLDELVSLSLLTFQPDTRYRQHALLADFAHEKVEGAATFTEVKERFVCYFEQVAFGEEEEVSADWGNLTTAIDVANEMQLWESTIALCQQLAPTFFTTGNHTSARLAYQLGHEAAQAIDDDIVQAEMLLRWGEVCLEQADYLEAKSLLVASLQTDDLHIQSEGMLHLARISIEQSEHEEAHQWLQDAQALKTELDDQVGLGMVAYRLGRLLLRMGDLESAEIHCRRAFALQENHDPLGIVKSMTLLSRIYVHRKQAKQAHKYSTQALSLVRPLNNLDELSTVLYQALSTAVRCGDHLAATQHANEVIPLFEQLGARLANALAHYELSISHEANGSLKTALQLARQSQTQLIQLNDRYNLTYLFSHEGDILSKMGEDKLAHAARQQALQIGTPIHHPEVPLLRQILNESSDLPQPPDHL